MDFGEHWLQPLADIHLYSDVGHDLPSGNQYYILGFSAVVVFILLPACINHVNPAIAVAAKRAKEIGMQQHNSTVLYTTGSGCYCGGFPHNCAAILQGCAGKPGTDDSIWMNLSRESRRRRQAASIFEQAGKIQRKYSCSSV
jgi:hypothetical protein